MWDPKKPMHWLLHYCTKLNWILFVGDYNDQMAMNVKACMDGWDVRTKNLPSDT
jgi:hypothetical protein